MSKEKFKCCICGKICEGYGNNPYPVSENPNDRCCDMCNNFRVVPERILRAYNMVLEENSTGE